MFILKRSAPLARYFRALGRVQVSQLRVVLRNRQGGADVAGVHRPAVHVLAPGEVAAQDLTSLLLDGRENQPVRALDVAAYLAIRQGLLAPGQFPGRAVLLLLFAHIFAYVPPLGAVEADADQFLDA
jgi:hypothetical protein